jgi:beta-lactamase class D
LRITPREQVAFAGKLARGVLPLRPATMAAVRDMIVLERDATTVLSGKTGSAEQDGRTIGWLVGTFTRGTGPSMRRWAYATLVLAPAGQMERVRPLRMEITRALLQRHAT